MSRFYALILGFSMLMLAPLTSVAQTVQGDYPDALFILPAGWTREGNLFRMPAQGIEAKVRAMPTAMTSADKVAITVAVLYDVKAEVQSNPGQANYAWADGEVTDEEDGITYVAYVAAFTFGTMPEKQVVIAARWPLHQDAEQQDQVMQLTEAYANAVQRTHRASFQMIRKDILPKGWRAEELNTDTTRFTDPSIGFVLMDSDLEWHGSLAELTLSRYSMAVQMYGVRAVKDGPGNLEDQVYVFDVTDPYGVTRHVLRMRPWKDGTARSGFVQTLTARWPHAHAAAAEKALNTYLYASKVQYRQIK